MDISWEIIIVSKLLTTEFHDIGQFSLQFKKGFQIGEVLLCIRTAVAVQLVEKVANIVLRAVELKDISCTVEAL